MAGPAPVVQCPKCSQHNSATSSCCHSCGAELTFDAADQTVIEEHSSQGWSVPVPEANAAAASGRLSVGTLLAGRYEIVQVLGEGGMGTVYKARDHELDRLVALKVVRPDLVGSPAILQRFKQELILARQITHKNVIRIFDLGTAEGVKFITMEYIEGRDLSSLLGVRNFAPIEAARIMRQVCRALEAAHGEGVVHRDLKPQNIMVGENDRVWVMDFGLARSVEMHGLTMTGAVLGTPAYMSPEQAKGGRIDTRSDLFSFGIIFYELLTGTLPYESDTLLGSLLKRTQEPPRPPAEVRPGVPAEFSEFVMRCLAVDPAARFQSASEMLPALDALAGVTSAPSAASLPVPQPVVKPWFRRWPVLALGVLVVIAAVTAILSRRDTAPVAPHKPVTLVVADFANRTGDAVFDGTLEPMFSLAMEGASFIAATPREQALRVGRQLQPGAGKLDETLARLVAAREGINVVVSGSISSADSGYAVQVRAVDAATGKEIASREARTAGKEQVLKTVAELATPLRRALGDVVPESVGLQAAEAFTAASLDAVHAHAVGLGHLAAGRKEEAIRQFSEAVRLDEKFARGYIGLAVAHMNLKKQAEAGEYYKKALALLDRVSEREKYRTLGVYYLSFVRNYPQAIETLRTLVARYPADAAGHNNLSLAYAFTGNLPEAFAASRRALEITPKNLQRRANFAGYSMLAGNFDSAIAEARRILAENPAFEYAYLPLALSTAAKGDLAGARDVYGRLEKASPRGFSVASMGQADLAMYRGRYREALQILEGGIAADEKANNTGEFAVKYAAKAEAHLALGQRSQAIQAAIQASESTPAESVLFQAARVLAQAGEEARAKALATLLEKRLQTQTKSYARLVEGEIALRQKRLPEAVEAFLEARRLYNSWIARFLLGRAYLEAGHFAEAAAEFETCLKRRGEAADLFMSDMATLRYLPSVSYWLARAQEGMGTLETARTSYQEFLKLRDGADPEDMLIADARRRN